MTLKYTTIEQLKRQCVIDIEDHSEDDILTELLESAEGWAKTKCQRDLDELTEGDELPADLKRAIIIYAATMYGNREGAAPTTFSVVPFANPEALIKPYIKYRGIPNT
jgi:uncharacterized phage protein (predicted DNA packaging)